MAVPTPISRWDLPVPESPIRQSGWPALTQAGSDRVPTSSGADEPGRDRVVALADGDPTAAVDLRRQRDAALELLERQRQQKIGLGDEVEPDAGQPPGQHPFVLLRVDLPQPVVQGLQRDDVGNRDQMSAAEPAAFLFDPALLVGALLARDAVERVEPDLPWVQEI
jgi:hypothetical protein